MATKDARSLSLAVPICQEGLSPSLNGVALPRPVGELEDKNVELLIGIDEFMVMKLPHRDSIDLGPLAYLSV